MQTYKQQIAALFQTNALLVTSDGITARVGSLSVDLERFMPWRTTDGKSVLPKGQPELPTDRRRVRAAPLDLLRWFTAFGETGSGLVKIIAGYHQYHAVNHAVDSTILQPLRAMSCRKTPCTTACPAWRSKRGVTVRA